MTVDVLKHKEPEKKAQKSKSETIVETVFLIATWVAQGMYLEIFGPTLIDLKQKFQTDYEGITVAISARSVGLLPGSVIGGVLVDKLGKYSYLLLAVCLDIAAIATAAIPWFQNVTILWFLCFVDGFVESVICIAGQRLVFRLWHEKAAAAMILLHSGYGFGSFITSVYSNQFLAKRTEQTQNGTCIPEENNSTIDSLTTSLVSVNNTQSDCFNGSRIEYSFAITASFLAIHSISLYIYQIRERRFEFFCDSSHEIETGDEKNEKSKNKPDERTFFELINPASCTDGRFCYGVQIFALVFLFAANAYGGGVMIGGFIRTFAVEELEHSRDEASYINTSFWISYSIGRIMFSIIAKWIKIRTLLFFQTLGLLGVTILMPFVVEIRPPAYWILVQLLAIFLAPLWPSCYAWTDFHLELTGMGMTLIIFGAAVGGTCHLRLIGYLYERVGSNAFLYQILGVGIVSFLLAVLLNVVGAKHGSRFDWKKPEEATIVVSKGREIFHENESLEWMEGKDSISTKL